MALADIPGYGAYIQRRQMNEQQPLAELQQVSAAQGLLANMQKQQQLAQMRAALEQSGGDVEKALQVAVQTGNIDAAHQLAPLAKLAQERRQGEETRRGLAALQTPPAAPQTNPMVPGPTASVMAGSGTTTPDAVPAPNAAQARIEHLNKMATLYATNPVVVQRIQAEIDRVQANADKAPQKRDRISGEELIQEEFKNGQWSEVGRGPRFARQVAPVVKVGGEGGGPAITDDTLAMDAWRYLTDGTLPPNMGRGVQGTAQATKIRNESARLAKEMGMTPDEIRMAQLTNKTQVQAIGQLAKAKAQILQFEKTAEYNADLALTASKDVWRTGSPLINRPVQWLRENAAGDPAASKFNAATETFVSEYARVMSGGYGAAQTTEGAQQRAHKLLNTAQGDAQFKGVVDLLKVEMKNRVRALETQMEEERGNLRRGVVRTPTPAAPAAPGPKAPTVDDLLKKYGGG